MTRADVRKPFDRVAVVGLGFMGMGMARNLVRASFQVAGFDLRDDLRRAAEESGVRAADTLAKAADGAGIVFVVVMNYQQVESVLFGQDGIAAVLKPGSVVVVCSTIGQDIAEIARRCEDKGLRVVDCPLTGGRAGADAGALTLIVSGSDDAVEDCRPAFDAISRRVFVAGPRAGLGQAAKAAVQSVVSAVAIAAAEGMAIASVAGVPAETVRDILQASVVQSPFLNTATDNILHGRFVDTGTSLAIMGKDIGIVVETAAANGLPSPLAQSLKDILARARVQFPDEDIWSVVKLITPDFPTAGER